MDGAEVSIDPTLVLINSCRCISIVDIKDSISLGHGCVPYLNEFSPIETVTTDESLLITFNSFAPTLRA